MKCGRKKNWERGYETNSLKENQRPSYSFEWIIGVFFLLVDQPYVSILRLNQRYNYNPPEFCRFQVYDCLRAACHCTWVVASQVEVVSRTELLFVGWTCIWNEFALSRRMVICMTNFSRANSKSRCLCIKGLPGKSSGEKIFVFFYFCVAMPRSINVSSWKQQDENA